MPVSTVVPAATPSQRGVLLPHDDGGHAEVGRLLLQAAAVGHRDGDWSTARSSSEA